MTAFDAEYLSRAWLSVAVASSTDTNRPALDRTICIETFPHGDRLVATDSTILLASWVPSVDDIDAPEPGPDESPMSTAIAFDEHGRARGFFAHLLRLATESGAEPIEARVQVGVRDLDPQTGTGTFDGMEGTYVIVEHPDHERLKLAVYEGVFPAYRKLLHEFAPKRTDAVALNPELVGRLAKVGKFNENRPLRWRFGGADKMALVEVEGDPHIYGAVMPMRVDWGSEA